MCVNMAFIVAITGDNSIANSGGLLNTCTSGLVVIDGFCPMSVGYQAAMVGR